MSWYRAPSIYSQKMKRLGAKIFNEYRELDMPKEIATGPDEESRKDFNYKNRTNANLVERQSSLPHDLSSAWNPNYYPPHPQIRELTFTLRKYGLFRDEHKDFTEEMKRLRILRGKVYRQLGGGQGKKQKLREMDKK